MKIGIIGSGSIGLLYSFYLSKKNSITLYTNRNKQAEDIRLNGITLLKGGKAFSSVNVSATSSRNYKEDLLIITVKQYHLELIISTLKELTPRTIIFLQNGMGHVPILPSLNKHQIILGVSEQGAKRINNHTVSHTGIGETKFSYYHNEGDLPLSSFCSVFEKNNQDFLWKKSDDWYEMLLEKLIINASINPLTALLQIKNGQLITNHHFTTMLKSVFNEVVRVFELSDEHYLWNRVLEVCQNTASNESSMNKDMQTKSLTEIDAILGYIITRAEQKQVMIPNVKLLFHAIKGLEGR